MKVSELTFDDRHPIRETLSESERQTLLDQLEDWAIESIDGIDRLVARFTFGNFAEALEFTNSVGDLAESFNHHPAITTEYGRVTVRWWTHTAGGITNNDFLLAWETSRLAD